MMRSRTYANQRRKLFSKIAWPNNKETRLDRHQHHKTEVSLFSENWRIPPPPPNNKRFYFR